jgi:Mg2+ and Co2+ transporter CorA
MRLQNFMNEEEITDDTKKKKERSDKTREQSKKALRNGLRVLEDHMDKFVEDIENEIEKIEDNPSFQYSIGLMLANLEKEQGEYILALRQVVQTIGKKAGIIPQVRAHAKGAVPPENTDDEEDVRDVVDDEKDKI